MSPQPNPIQGSNLPGIALGDIPSLSPAPPATPLVSTDAWYGPWLTGLTYPPGAIVTLDNITYLALQPNISSEPDSHADTWQPLTAAAGGGGVTLGPVYIVGDDDDATTFTTGYSSDGDDWYTSKGGTPPLTAALLIAQGAVPINTPSILAPTPLAYWKDTLGLARLRGYIFQTAEWAFTNPLPPIFTLPAGYWPTVVIADTTGGTFGRWVIDDTGNVYAPALEVEDDPTYLDLTWRTDA